MRKRLSDITNSQSQSPVQEENLPMIGIDIEEHINRVMKENLVLVKLLEERDKIIKKNTMELQNLRVDIHKIQVQNWSLAQSNSQFLAEINLARNKVKALQHEVMCKNALLKSKNRELEERVSKKPTNPQNMGIKNHEIYLPRNTIVMENLQENVEDDIGKAHKTIERPNGRSKSMGGSIAQRSEADKAKAEATRRRMRRKSARFRSQDHEDGESLFEIEDLKLTMTNNTHENRSNARSYKPNNTPKKDEEQDEEGRSHALTRTESCNETSRRSSIGRPPRQAVEKVHSYKETPLNTKMRRSQ